MKNSLKTTFLALAAIFMLSGSLLADTYKVNEKASKLAWSAEKVTGKHDGYVNVKSGSLNVENGVIKNGSFDIDMTSITCRDLEDKEYNQKLVGHLKSDDFFSVDKHNTAKFVIEKVTPKSGNQHYIKGKLTIKGITKDVKFVADINNGGTSLKASGEIVIDRTDFNVRYGSGSFFDNLGDKVIYDEFKIKVDLEATKG